MSNFEAGSSPEIYGTITRKNLDVVRRSYGDGSPGEGLPYHNELHTLGVIKNVKTMTSLWNKEFPDDPLTARDELLLEIAASGHDRVVDGANRIPDFKPGDNERMSAEEVAKDMQEAGGYSAKDIAFVRACILGTIPEFKPDGLSQPMSETRQMLEAGEISDYQFELAKLLADADLASFGQGFEVFSEWALRLFKEMKRNPDDFEAYLRYEIAMLENHDWVSKLGAKAFPHKQESIDALKKLLADRTTA